MLIVETSIFSRLIQELMSDDEYRQLQEALIIRRDLGALEVRRERQKWWRARDLLLGNGG